MKRKRTTQNSSRLTVPERHQLKIARDTLRMSPAMAKVMGGMTVAQAREVFKTLMAKARGAKNPRLNVQKTALSLYRRMGQARAIKWATQERHHEVSTPWHRARGSPFDFWTKVREHLRKMPADLPTRGRGWTKKNSRRKTSPRRRRNYFEERITRGSRVAVISANEATGPFSIRVYVDYGQIATPTMKKAKTITGARKIAAAMLSKFGNPPETVMSRFKRHTLRSSSGRKVTRKPMAKAILLSELRAAGRIPPRKNRRRRKKNELDPRWKKTLAARQHSHERFIKRALEIHHPGKKFGDLTAFEQSAVLQFAHKLQREDAAGLKNPRRNSVTWGRMRKKPSKRIRAALRKIGRKRKRNYENAEELYERFHGRKAGRVSDTGLPVADYGSHDELGQLGKLVSLTIGDKEADKPWCKQITWGGSEAPDLAAEPGGSQLYLVGGNQNIDRSLDKLPIDTTKDMLDLGFVYQIEYFTRKAFDNHQPVTYYHDLGEETGESPRVVYDRVKRRIHLVGGAYKVKPEGVVN